MDEQNAIGHLMPRCPYCNKAVQPGDMMIDIVAEVYFGGTKLAMGHLSCALLELEKQLPERLPRQSERPPGE